MVELLKRADPRRAHLLITSPVSTTFATRAFVGIAAVLALGRLWFTAVAPLDRVLASFMDDAYYYFGVARNIAEGFGSTFNGVDQTNGYHPLWLALLIPVSVVHDLRLFLFLVTALAAVSFAGSAYLTTRLAHESGAGSWLLVAALPLLATGTVGPAYWFSGMESAVCIPAALLVTRWYLRLDDGLSASPATVRRAAGAGGVALTVLMAARLDLVFTAVLFAAVSSWPVLHHASAARRRAWLVRLVGIPAGAVTAFVVANRLVFGSALPSSGVAKSLGHPFLNLEVIGQLVRAPLIGVPTYLGLIGPVLAAAALAATRRPAEGAEVGAGAGALRRLAEAGAVLVAGAWVSTLYYSVASSWPLWPWYFATVPVAVMCSGGALLAAMRPRVTVRAAVAGAGALVVLETAGELAQLLRARPVPLLPIVQSSAEASRMSERTSSGGAVAMGDGAGALGFLGGRPLIQLEGLVESADYIDALQRGDVPAFLAARHVEVYVRNAGDAGEPAGPPGCTRYPEPLFGRGPKFWVTVCDADRLSDAVMADGSYFRVWRYRPDLNR
jgi:hypothetical protein